MAGARVRIIRDNRNQIMARTKDVAERELARAAEETRALAEENAPKKTGFLASSIATGQDGRFRHRTEVGAEYGAFVELGTTKQAAKPYLLPAFMTATGNLLQRLRRNNRK